MSSVFNAVRIILYRCHEKGLEILLINHDLQNDPDVWKIPSVKMALDNQLQIIELDDTTDTHHLPDQGVKTIALEADWHDIPSIRGLIKHDVKLVKSKIKKKIPHLEQGTYFTIKEAFKKVLPQEYKILKELKDIIFDRNIATNI